MQLVVTQADLEQIEELLLDFLNSFYPDQDFSQGTPLNDLLVQGFKVPLGLLQSVATRFQQTRSLSGVQELLDAINASDQTDPDIIDAQAELSSAVIEILSNWFITKQDGTTSRGLVNLHFSTNETVVIPSDFRCFRTLDLPFLNASNNDIIVTVDDYQVIRDDIGIVLEYIYRITVEAEFTGAAGDIEPGDWESFDEISPFLTRVSSDFTFTQGNDEETTQDLIDRAQDGGVTERTLHNQRSLNARFGEEFPSFLPVRSIGAGDPEMQRDLLFLGGSFRIHRLNHYNIYVGGNILESQVFSGVLGEGGISARTGEVIDAEDNYVLLPNVPITNIREIRYLNETADPRLQPYTDTDGYVRLDLLSRFVNNSASGARELVSFTDLNQCYIEPLDTESVYHWNTAFQTHRLRINPLLFQSQGQTIEIVHDTIQGFDTVHDLIQTSDERPEAGDPLVFAYYPAVVTFTLQYKRNEGVSTSVDIAEAKRVLTAFIRSQKNGNPLYASEIMREFQDNFGDISAGVAPITLNYSVQLPDGARIEYSTTESVSIASLTNLTSTSYVPTLESGGAQRLTDLQLSDRTLQVYADEEGITVQELP